MQISIEIPSYTNIIWGRTIDSGDDSEDEQPLQGKEEDDQSLKVNNGKMKLASNGENRNKIIKCKNWRK